MMEIFLHPVEPLLSVFFLLYPLLYIIVDSVTQASTIKPNERPSKDSSSALRDSPGVGASSVQASSSLGLEAQNNPTSDWSDLS
jgi:hypothetical protein